MGLGVKMAKKLTEKIKILLVRMDLITWTEPVLPEEDFLEAFIRRVSKVNATC